VTYVFVITKRVYGILLCFSDPFRSMYIFKVIDILINYDILHVYLYTLFSIAIQIHTEKSANKTRKSQCSTNNLMLNKFSSNLYQLLR